jgi:hypothetical protein
MTNPLNSIKFDYISKETFNNSVKLINEYFEKNKDGVLDIATNLYLNIMQYIISQLSKSNYSKIYILENNDIYLLLFNFFKYTDATLTSNHIYNILYSPYAVKIFTQYVETGKRFNIECTKTFINLINNYEETDLPIINFIESYDVFDADISIIEQACKNNLLKFVLHQINKKIKLSQICLYNAIKNNNIELAKITLLSGCNIDYQCLIFACETLNYDTILFVINNNITPDKKCFDAIISSEIESQKVVKSKPNKTKLIDLLIEFGYKVTYDDLVMATNAHVVINNLKNLNIQINDDFLKVCSKAGFYVYDDIIKPTITDLELACEKPNNLKCIKQLISSGLKPNMKCLRNACSLKANLGVIKFIENKGNIKPDAICLKNIANASGNAGMNYIVDEFIKKYSNVLDKYDKNQTNQNNDQNKLLIKKVVKSK